MGYQSAYTKALLGIDVANESIKERRELEKAQSDREKEEGIKSLAGTILGVAGSAFGPIGGFIGKTIGTLGADLLMDSEQSQVSKGKFRASDSDIINRDLDDFDRDSNIANVINVGVSALSSFAFAGGVEGLKETLEGGGSVMDFATSFGAGDEAKKSLFDWMKMSGGEKAAANLSNISYFEYLLGISGKEEIAEGIVSTKVPGIDNQFLIPEWQKNQGGFGDTMLNFNNPAIRGGNLL